MISCSGISLPKNIISFLLFLAVGFTSTQGNAQDKNLQGHARALINLLDYVSQDYANAVSKGKIINPAEYREMMDFSEETISLFDSVSAKIKMDSSRELSSQLRKLHQNVKNKAPKELIANRAQQIKKRIMLLHIIDISPVQYPDIDEGKKLYAVSCQSCHGKTGAGDGPAGIALDPPPANFLSDSMMKYISPLQIYNTTRLGVQGTSMRAFDELTDDQVWQIAFYIKSLPYEKPFSDSAEALENIYKKIQAGNPLADIAHLSDKELEKRFSGDNREMKIAALRLHRPANNKSTPLHLASALLNESLHLYREKNTSLAGQKALFAYLDGVEPVEQQLRAIDAHIVNELETNMNKVRSSIKKNRSFKEVEQNIITAKASIVKASQLLGEQTYTFWFSFLIAASILLREGLEAVLIIITILSLLKSLKAKKAIHWVHAGWIAALAIGIISWFFTEWLLAFGSQNREVMEAAGSMVAVLVLIYVGFWLHNKTEAKKWQRFIKTRIAGLLDQKKMFGLAFISFVVVFREAFESILFLSSMQLQVDNSGKNGVWMGAVTAIIIVIFIAFLLLRFSVHIPIRQLFQYSAFIIMILAVILAGQGIHAFQEAGFVSVTSVPINFHAGMLGIFPTAETLTAQILVGLIIVFMWLRRSGKSAMAVKAA